MASEVEMEGVAGLLAVHFPVDSSVDDIPEGEIRCNWIDCGFTLEEDEDDQWRGLFAKHQAEQLAAAGIGHIPTALYQAADALDTAANNATYETGPGLDEAETIVRARADRAGGTA